MMKVLYDRRIYANVDGLRNVIRILGRSNEQIRSLKAEDIIDERIARKLKKRDSLKADWAYQFSSSGLTRNPEP
jgi:hypothetical protein